MGFIGRPGGIGTHGMFESIFRCCGSRVVSGLVLNRRFYLHIEVHVGSTHLVQPCLGGRTGARKGIEESQ